DEARLLLLERQRTTAVLRVIDLESGNREVWSRRIRLWASKLAFSRASRQWQLLGWNDSGDLASVAGRIGEETASEEQWKSAGTDMNEIEPLALSNGNVLAIETRFISSRRAAGPLQLWAAAMIPPAMRSESQLWTIGRQGRAA